MRKVDRNACIPWKSGACSIVEERRFSAVEEWRLQYRGRAALQRRVKLPKN